MMIRMMAHKGNEVQNWMRRNNRTTPIANKMASMRMRRKAQRLLGGSDFVADEYAREDEGEDDAQKEEGKGDAYLNGDGPSAVIQNRSHLQGSAVFPEGGRHGVA